MLLAYIGDALSPADREAFDHRLLEDEEFSHQVEEAEFTLVEEYVDRSLSAEERAMVGPWIVNSPERHGKAAIAAALRVRATDGSNIHIMKRRVMPAWLWASAAAACIALLVALPLLRHKQPAPAVVAQLNTALVVQPNPAHEDTILLQAQRLRSIGEGPKAPVTYKLNVEVPTRIQIIVPLEAARGQYSVDLRQSSAQPGSRPIHLDGLLVNQKNNLSYVEFSLPAGFLSIGAYEGDLHSKSATYRLKFSVDHSSSSPLMR